MKECWQPVFVYKVKRDLKNSFGWFFCNSLFADLGQDLSVGHPTGIHQPCTASDIRKILPKALQWCFWCAVFIMWGLDWVPCAELQLVLHIQVEVGRAPETWGPCYWCPHGSFPVGAGWSWVGQLWASPVFPTWALRQEGLPSCTSLGKAHTELTPGQGVFSPQGLSQAIPVVGFYVLTAVLGHSPAQRVCQRTGEALRDCCGAGESCWCWSGLCCLCISPCLSSNPSNSWLQIRFSFPYWI